MHALLHVLALHAGEGHGPYVRASVLLLLRSACSNPIPRLLRSRRAKRAWEPLVYVVDIDISPTKSFGRIPYNISTA